MTTDSTNSRLFRLCVPGLALLLLGAPGPAHADESAVYKVANLSVDMKAKDAVTAKTQALALAKRRALNTVLRRIAPFNSFDRMPEVKAEAIDDMLEGFSVQRERNSATQYLATLDFSFSAEEVRKLLSARGIPVTDQQAKPVAVLPVYIDKGKIDHSGRDPWRTAWNALDLAHAIVPVKLVRTGPSFTMDSLSTLLGGDVQAFVALRDKFNAGRLVLSIAEMTADGKTLTTRMFGVDHVGSLSLTRNDPVPNGGLKPVAGEAAAIMLEVVEGRWKLVQSPAGGAEGDTTMAGIDVVVEFAGMRQWQEIRSRLVKVPGVNGLDVKSLSARTAQVAFQFPGNAERLSRALAPHGLSLHGADGAWILRSN